MAQSKERMTLLKRRAAIGRYDQKIKTEVFHYIFFVFSLLRVTILVKKISFHIILNLLLVKCTNYHDLLTQVSRLSFHMTVCFIFLFRCIVFFQWQIDHFCYGKLVSRATSQNNNITVC